MKVAAIITALVVVLACLLIENHRLRNARRSIRDAQLLSKCFRVVEIQGASNQISIDLAKASSRALAKSDHQVEMAFERVDRLKACIPESLRRKCP